MQTKKNLIKSHFMHLQDLLFRAAFTLFKILNVPKNSQRDSDLKKDRKITIKGICITKIMPYNLSLHSQWEVGLMFIPILF